MKNLAGDYLVSTGSSKSVDALTEGLLATNLRSSVLGQRSLIDDILITSALWDFLYEKVK